MSDSPSLNALDRLTAILSRIPGVGKKSAARMAYFFLDSDPGYCQTLAEQLSGLHEAIRRCSVCGAYTESDPCPICSDETRDRSLLCVVERPQDVRIIEESHEYKGLFHVLGGLIAPLDGVGPDHLSLGSLLSRLRSGEVQEVIIALNPTVEGDTTALYIRKILEEHQGSRPGAAPTVTRLASGLPVGGDLEYADRLTLSRSFRGRASF
jgi:recombination protein RecR